MEEGNGFCARAMSKSTGAILERLDLDFRVWKEVLGPHERAPIGVTQNQFFCRLLSVLIHQTKIPCHYRCIGVFQSKADKRSGISEN